MNEDDSETIPAKKAKVFCCQTFRQEIKGSETIKSLKRFVTAAKNSEDVIYEYMEGGGSISEILSIIDSTAKGDLMTALPVFETAHLILLSFQSPDSKYHQQCIEGAKTILQSHLPIIKSMLDMNDAKQRKVALKLMTAIVTIHSYFATQIMNTIQLTPALIASLIQPTGNKESVRKYFILFVLSFFIGGNSDIIKNFLEKKNYVSCIIPGLKFDDPNTVNLTLSLFEDKILKNSHIQKTLKLNIFNTQTIRSLLDLYDWKGLRGVKKTMPLKKNRIKEVEVDEKEKAVVVESVHSFLLVLCCSQKYGVAFSDKSLGTSDHLNNQLLLNVFERLSDPLKDEKMAELLLKTLVGCPDLIKPILNKLEPSFQPRNSKSWFDAIKFTENLLQTLNVAEQLKSEKKDSISFTLINKAAKNVCAPIALLKVCKTGSQKSEPLEIRLFCLKLLTTMWAEIQKLFFTFPKYEEDLKKSIHFISNFLPDAKDLLDMWHNLCSLEFAPNPPISTDQRPLFLSVVVTSLHIIIDCDVKKDFIFSPLNLASDMLKHLKQIKNTVKNTEFNEIQVKIVHFVEMDLDSLTPNMNLFKKSFLILARSSEDDSLRRACKLITRTTVFQNNKFEVDVWLMCLVSLPLNHREIVVDYLIKSLRQALNKSGDPMEGLQISKITELLEDVKESVSQLKIESSLTQLAFECLEIIKAELSAQEENKSKVEAFQRYLCFVLLYLQHFYNDNVFLYDNFKSYKQVISKPIMNYLKCWRNNSLGSNDADVFSTQTERELISWLLNEEDRREMENVLQIKKSNLLKMYSLYLIVVAFLTKKAANGSLTDGDVEKYVSALLFFLQMEEPLNEEFDGSFELVSYEYKNPSNFHKISLGHFLSNKFLLNNFDVFQRNDKGVVNTTTVVFKVFLKNDTICNYSAMKNLLKPWKLKFLKQIKSKLKKSKSIDDNVVNVENVFDFFDYDQSEVEEMIRLLFSISDLSLFMYKKGLSKWATILVKLIKMDHLTEDSIVEVIRKLYFITKYLCEENCSEMEAIDECWVYLLKKHPQSLLTIENEFLELILNRTNTTSSTATLGKIILNEPNKVKHLLNFVSSNLENIKETKLLFSMMSVLIVDRDPFLEIIKSEDVCLVWNTSDLQENSSSEYLKIFGLIYDKFQKEILRGIAGEKEEIVLENFEFSKLLIKLFTDKKEIKSIKKEIIEGEFDPELLFEVVKKVKKTKITETFLQGLLSKFHKIIKNSHEEEEETLWLKYCSIVAEVVELLKDSSRENVVESSEWKEFPKIVLGHCFNTSKNPSLLKILRILITALEKEEKNFGLYFQMLISHSQFLNNIFKKSILKVELVELFHCLIEKSPSEMSPKHIPILLASYTATLSSSDQTLLKIIRLYEEKGVAISEYEPFVWGEAAISHYSIGTSSGLSLWQRFNMVNVLDLLDNQKIEYSLRHFPIQRSLEMNETLSECDPDVYDPAFLLPLFTNLLSPGSVAFCSPFVCKGALGYTVRALSSQCAKMRIAASVVLNRLYTHLELSQHMKKKLVWMHFIKSFCYNISDISSETVSNVVTLFCAKLTLELSGSPTEMFLPLKNYLTAKPSFSFNKVPEFLILFCSSEAQHWKHQQWLLEIMKDGVQAELDLKVVFYTMAIKVIFCFFHSPLCDNDTKRLILQVMEKLQRHDKSMLLITEYSLLNWMDAIDVNSCQRFLPDLLKLLSTTATTVINDMKNGKRKRTNLSHIVQILNISIKLIEAVKSSESTNILEIYLNMIHNCFLLFVNSGRYEWFRVNKNKIENIVEAGVAILGEKYDTKKFSKILFYFRDFENEYNTDVTRSLKNSVFLFNFLANRKHNDINKEE